MTTSEPDPAATATAFRRAMGRWATGVSVVTAHVASGDAGLTVNALLSVALEPPSLLVSLQQDADTLPVLRRSRAFGVSLLASTQRELSRRFARAVGSEEKFRGVPFHRGPSGAPLLDGALAAFDCRLVSETLQYDHVLVVGEVTHIEEGPDTAPLLFFQGGYAEVEGGERLRLPRRGP